MNQAELTEHRMIKTKSIRLLIIVFLFMLIANPVLLVAQNANESVNDNGFRIFHFGDSVEQYGTDVCVWFPVENIVRYKYCGNDTSICKIGDIRFDDVVLCFNKENRLFLINISLYKSQKTTLKEFKKLQGVLYERMSAYLDSLYGKEYREYKDNEGASQIWAMHNMIISLKMFGGGNNYWCRFGISFRKNFNEADQ